MRKLAIILAIAASLVLMIGVVSLSPAVAASTLVGASIVPIHMNGGHGSHMGSSKHMGFNHNWQYRNYGRWGYPGYLDSGTYQDGNKTCVWNGYQYNCYLFPDGS